MSVLSSDSNEPFETTADAHRKALLYVECGSLYFQLEQYDKTVSNYETAAAFDPGVFIPQSKLKIACRKMAEEKPSSK